RQPRRSCRPTSMPSSRRHADGRGLHLRSGAVCWQQRAGCDGLPRVRRALHRAVRAVPVGGAGRDRRTAAADGSGGHRRGGRRAGGGAVLIAWALTIAIGAESAGAVLNRMITRVLLPAAVVLFLLSGVATYQQWLVTWISQLPDDIGRAVTGGLGGAAVNSGDPFAHVWDKGHAAGAAG